PGAFERTKSNGPDGFMMTIINPTQPFCPGLEDVSVAIMNYGNTQLSNFNINWTINGVPQPVFNYTGTLDTIGGAGEFMDTVLLGVGNFPIGMHNLSTWVVVANDVDNNNDTITTTINAIQYAAVLENDTICKVKDAKV